MAFAPSFVGNNSIGASLLPLEEDSSYLTQVSIPAGAILSAIEVHGQVGAEASSYAYTPVVFTDNAGAPELLLVGDSQNNGGTGVALFDDALRWWSFPVGMYFGSATTVWIGVLVASSNISFSLSYETTGGGDKQVDRGQVAIADASVSTVVDTTEIYSIRGRIIEW